MFRAETPTRCLSTISFSVHFIYKLLLCNYGNTFVRENGARKFKPFNWRSFSVMHLLYVEPLAVNSSFFSEVTFWYHSLVSFLILLMQWLFQIIQIEYDWDTVEVERRDPGVESLSTGDQYYPFSSIFISLNTMNVKTRLISTWEFESFVKRKQLCSINGKFT